MSSLLQNQCERLAGARYPLHMPGHKRRVPPAPGLSCYAFDLTEIDGADATSENVMHAATHALEHHS